MTLAFAAPGLALVAADTRFSFPDHRGVQDLGQKVRRVPGGWVAGSGSASVVLLGLRAIERVGVQDVERVGGLIQAVHRRVALEHPEADISDSGFLMVQDRGLGNVQGVLASDGLAFDRSPGFIFWPPGAHGGLSESIAASRAYLSDMAACKSTEATIRRVAGSFLSALDNGGRMSPEIELGLTIEGSGALYLRKPARWLVDAAAGDISRALTRPPHIDPFPQLPPERLVFIRNAEQEMVYERRNIH